MAEDENTKAPAPAESEAEAAESELPEDQTLPEAAAPEPAAETPGSNLETPLASPELDAAMQEALSSLERRAKPEEEAPPPPTKKELELKMQILDLQHTLRQLEADLEKRTQEVHQNFEQGQRLKEQLEGYRVRIQKEKADWFNYGHEPLLRELLPVMDNLERALGHAKRPEDFEVLKQGVDLTRRLFLQVLSKFGVEPISALGQGFDPALHEAMRAAETEEAAPNSVVEEHQRGYRLRDRLLRPSMVTIARKPGRPAEDQENERATPASQPEDISESEPAKEGEE
jgi:molecular chaperone GrpE